MKDTTRDRLLAIGWLLTPLVVWAASFFGAWLGALVARQLGRQTIGIELMAGGAVIVTIVATLLWIRLLRRSRWTRHPSPPSA